jgi:hypothetical protein
MWEGADKGYYVNLDRARTGDEACDRINQLRLKNWTTRPALDELAMYLQSILGQTCDCLQRAVLGPSDGSRRIFCEH